MSATPKGCLVDASAFGRSRMAEWVQPETARGAALMSAARMQHEAAIYVRMFLRAEERTQGWLACTVQWRRERVSRVLGGQVWVSLADLEEMLGACGTSVAGVSWMSAHVDDRATPARQIVATFLREQLHRLDPSTPLL
jgi:hypothetical protein